MSLRLRSKILRAPFFFLFLGVLLLSSVNPVNSADLKIAYINSQRILEESKAGKETSKKIQKLEQEKADQMTQKKKEIEELENELRKKEFAITPERKKEIEDDIKHKGLELKFFEEGKDKEIKDFYYKSLKKIEGEIMTIVLQLGQDEGYDLILGRDESGILYANPKQDITDKIIQAYDQQVQQ